MLPASWPAPYANVELSTNMNDQIIPMIALIISITALGLSIYFWRMQFRPIITVTVKTAAAGNISTAFNLQVKNSGSLPAKDIKLSINQLELQNVFGAGATEENKIRWLAAFEDKNTISILQNGESITCSFGTSMAQDKGFWKYLSIFQISIEYYGWFGYHYVDTQKIKIVDSDSFTDFQWERRS